MSQDKSISFVSEADILSEEFYDERSCELQNRVSPKRFSHSLGVSNTAIELARVYEVNERHARLAGLLHDWDKNYNDDEIRQIARNLNIAFDSYSLEQMPMLLHGPTAAVELAHRYPCMPQEIIRSIELHTTGAVDMTDLDMIIYVADAIEPGRRYDGLDAIRELIGKVGLEELFLATFQHVMLNLVSRKRRVYPRTLDVWNHYVVRYRKAAGKL